MNENTLKLNHENGRYEGTYTITFQVEAEIVRRALFRYAEENNIDPANIVEWQKAIEAVTRTGKWIDHPRAKWLDYPHAKPVIEAPAPTPVSLPAPESMPEQKPERIQKDEIIAILQRAGHAMGIAEILAQMKEPKPLYDTLNKALLRKVEQGILYRPTHGRYALASPLPMKKPHKPASHEVLSPEDELAIREQALQLPVDEWDSLLMPIPDGSHKDKQPIYRRRYAEKQALARLKAELEPARPDTLEAVAEAVNGTRMR